MDNININIDSKAARKLMDTVASGVGAVAGHWFMRGKARAQGDSIRIIAQAQKDAEEIATGTKRLALDGTLVDVLKTENMALIEIGAETAVEARLTYQEQKRQGNLIEIVHKAQKELPEEVSDQEVDPDWVSRFFTYAQDISAEEMQFIWAKILVGEVASPGRTSSRTLECLRNLTKAEAQTFEKIKPFIIEDFVLRSVCEPPEKYGIDFVELLSLQQAGLLDPNWTLQKIYKSLSTKTFINQIVLGGSRLAIIKHPEKANEKINVGAVVLTQAGRELLYATKKVVIDDAYLQEFMTRFGGYETEIVNLDSLITTKA